MADFNYIAETPTGERVSGRLAAVDEAAANHELAARGLTAIELNRVAEAKLGAALDDDTLGTLMHTLESAAANRLPLEASLAALAEDSDDRRLASVSRRLAAELQRGATIGEAMSAVESQMPAEVRELFRVAVECGDMAGCFERFTQQRRARQRTRRRIRAATFYPLLIALILVPVALLLSLSVIPMFAELYSDFGLTLPLVTRWTISAAEQLPTILGATFLLVFVISVGLPAIGGRALSDRVRGVLPMIGHFWLWSGQREFAATLAAFLELRQPLPIALAHTGDILGDKNVSRACRGVNERLRQGAPLSASLADSIHFDRSLVALVAWGERNESLPAALGIATEVFDDRIEQRATFLQRIVPPLTLIVVGSAMLMVILGLFVPLVSLIENLSG